jgi:CMP/dCMP kinase
MIDRRGSGSGMTNGTRPSLAGDQDHHEDAMSNSLDHRENGPPTNGEDHRRVIAIDGPAAAGKSTVARALADRLGATYLDTGLLYRTVTLAAIRAGLAPDDGEAIARLARQCTINVLPPRNPGETEHILLDGELVTPELRTAEIDRNVSAVSAHQGVRDELLPVQRRIASDGTVVMVGRDITTVVIPNAGVRVYLNASPEERARRRHKELQARGRTESYASVLDDIRRRDLADSSRAAAPLHAGKGVTIVETDGRSVDAIVDEIVDLARKSWQGQPAVGQDAGAI